MADAPGVMGTAEEAAYELRCAEGATWTGSRLLIGVCTFAFAGLAFAYFYLRSINSEGLWRPGHVTPSILLGTLIGAAVLGGAAINSYGMRRMRATGATTDWEVGGWLTVGLGITAFGLQVWEMSRLPFYPGSSGYSSCFIAWGIFNAVFILGGSYWLETLLARSIRLRRAVAEDGGAGRSQLPPAKLFRANMEGCSYFWWYMGLVSLLFWLLFYII
ncbi:MAG: hypothetical protein ACRDYD_03025 [Acidimicrobiales bacterium]